MPIRAIFISYRRADAEGQAGRLYDDLVRDFGDGSIFMDVAAIEPGLDFRKVIDKSVSSCGVLLAVIGPAWVDAKDESGRRRLDNPLDFVRLETAAALKRDIPVVPVLVAKASMPMPEQLPDDLKELAYRNGVELTHARWDSDVQVLVKALRRIMENPPPAPSPVAKADPAPVPPSDKKAMVHVENAGGGDIPTPRPVSAWKPSRPMIAASLVALLIAAIVGYALYESKRSTDQEAARQEAAASQSVEEREAAERDQAGKAADEHEATEIPDFAGTWEAVEATFNGEQQVPIPEGLQRPVTITQKGSLVTFDGGAEKGRTITGDGSVTYQTFVAQSGRGVASEAEAANVNTFTWRLEGSILVFEITMNYKAPFDNHPIGTDLSIVRYRRRARNR